MSVQCAGTAAPASAGAEGPGFACNGHQTLLRPDTPRPVSFSIKSSSEACVIISDGYIAMSSLCRLAGRGCAGSVCCCCCCCCCCCSCSSGRAVLHFSCTVRMCFVRLPERPKVLVHVGHLNFLYPLGLQLKQHHCCAPSNLPRLLFFDSLQSEHVFISGLQL